MLLVSKLREERLKILKLIPVITRKVVYFQLEWVVYFHWNRWYTFAGMSGILSLEYAVAAAFPAAEVVLEAVAHPVDGSRVKIPATLAGITREGKLKPHTTF